MSSRARKRARAAAAGEVTAKAPARNEAKPPSRSEAKNAAVREGLQPLAPGERPGAVSAAALVGAILLLMNIAAAIFGYDTPGGGNNLAPLLVYTVLLGVMTWGLWKAKYWAVLGMQALLALTMLFSGLAAPLASDAVSAIIATAVFLSAGTLFYFLIKAMARIQMPERR